MVGCLKTGACMKMLHRFMFKISIWLLLNTEGDLIFLVVECHVLNIVVNGWKSNLIELILKYRFVFNRATYCRRPLVQTSSKPYNRSFCLLCDKLRTRLSEETPVGLLSFKYVHTGRNSRWDAQGLHNVLHFCSFALGNCIGYTL